MSLALPVFCTVKVSVYCVPLLGSRCRVAPSGVTFTPADTLGQAVTAACLERGLHLNIVQLPGMGGIFRIAPPLTIAESELHEGLDILDDALASVLV